MKKKKNYKLLIPDLIPYDNNLIYKELAKEFGLTLKEVEYIVRTNYRFLRKFINTHFEKNENFNCRNLGVFRVYKRPDTEEERMIKNRIECVISRYIQVHINEDDVRQLKEWKSMGFHIPYEEDIFVNGRKRIRKQLIDPDIRPHLPEDYFVKHGAVWIEKPPEPIAPEDSVMEKFKGEEFGSSEFDIF